MEKLECCIDKTVHADIVKQACDKMFSADEFEDMSMLFKMFADATRLKIMKALLEHEMCVCDLAALLNMTHSAVSHQLASLKKMRLVRSSKSGKNVYYNLADEHIEQIISTAYVHIKE